MHDPHRAGYIPQPGLAGKEHFQTETNQTDGIHTGLPGCFCPQSRSALRQGEADTVAQNRIPVIVGKLPHFHVYILIFYDLPVTADGKIMDVTGVQGHEQGKIGIHINLLPVQRNKGIPGLDIVRKGAVFFHHTDLGENIIFVRCQENTDHHDAGNKIHGSAGHKNYETFPPGGIRKSTGIVAVSVLSLHCAVTANRDAADGVKGLPPLLLPDSRTHEQGKLIHLNAKGFGKSEVPQLMDKDQKAEKDNCENNAHRFASKIRYCCLGRIPQAKRRADSVTAALACRSASRICSRVGSFTKGTRSTAPATKR